MRCPCRSRSCWPAVAPFWYRFPLQDRVLPSKLTIQHSTVDLLDCSGFTSDLVRFFVLLVFLRCVPSVLTVHDSAEVIGLSLRTAGIHPYLNVQGFTGAMYIASFISRMAYPLPRCYNQLTLTV